MAGLPRVLVVDDEPMVLEAIERNLDDDFEIATAPSGADALCVMTTQPPFATIISDMRMPHMNGAEFLLRARQLAPDTTRILLTGHSETSAAIAAVNDGRIFRFLSKPCPPEALRQHVADGIRQHQLVKGERDLLENTLRGAIQLMSDLLALAAPALFERSRQLRDRVAHAAKALDCPNVWEYELAALLAHIGCVALPPGLVEKVWAGGRISADERASYDGHPATAHKLIAAIPRLERVAQIVLLQHGKKRPGDPVIERGVALLQAAVQLDQLVGRRVPLPEALEVLREHHHDPQMVEALGEHARHHVGCTRIVMLAEVRVGWVIDRDVTSPGGALLVKAGTTLSPVLVESLRKFAAGVGVVEPLFIRAS